MTVCLDLISRLQEYCLVFNSHCSKMSWSRPSHQYSLLFIHWVVPGIVWFKLPAVFYSSCPFFFSSWLSDCEYTAVEYFTWLWFINKPWGFCYIQETHYTWMVQSKKKKKQTLIDICIEMKCLSNMLLQFLVPTRGGILQRTLRHVYC